MPLIFPFYLVVFLYILTYFIYTKNSDEVKVSYSLAIITLGLFWFAISMRSFVHEGDTATYINLFQEISRYTSFEYIFNYRLESGFLVLLDTIGSVSLNPRFFLFLLSLVLVLVWAMCFKIWIKGSEYLICCLIFISLFSSYNLGANIVRQGIAIPLALVSIYCLFNRKFFASIVFCVLGLLFHKSIIVIYIFAILSRLFNSVVLLLSVMLIMSFASAAGILQLDLISKLVTGYTNYSHIISNYANDRYVTGFRLSFWAFSMIPILLYACVEHSLLSRIQQRLFITYVMLIILFIFLFMIPFSDRIGIMAWSMFPILITSFMGKFKYNLLNTKVFIVAGIGVFGVLSFIFYPTLKVGYLFSNII